MNSKHFLVPIVLVLVLFSVSLSAASTAPSWPTPVKLYPTEGAPTTPPFVTTEGPLDDVLKPFSDGWNAFSKGFQLGPQKPSTAPTLVPPATVDFPKRTIGSDNKLDVLVKLPANLQPPVEDGDYAANIKINGIPVSEHLFPFHAGETELAQTISIPNPEPGKPVEISVEVFDSSNQKIAETKGTALASWQNPAFSNQFLELPDSFGSYDEKKQEEEFDQIAGPNRPEPNIFNISALPLGKKFFAVQFNLPLEGAPLLRVYRQKKTSEIEETSFDYFLEARIRLNNSFPADVIKEVPIQVENGRPTQNSILDEPLQKIQLSKGKLSGAFAVNLFSIKEIENETRAISVPDLNPEKPIMVSYEFGLYGIEKGNPQNRITFWAYKEGPFELKRELPKKEPEPTTPSSVVLEKEGTVVTELVGPPAPDQPQADAACVAPDTTTAASLPANAEAELEANGIPISKYTLGVQAAMQCFQLDGKTLTPIIQRAWEQGKRAISFAWTAMNKGGKKTTLAKTEIPLLSSGELKQLSLRLLDASGNEIKTLVDPVQPIKLEVTNFDSRQRLYVFAAPDQFANSVAGKSIRCGGIADRLRGFVLETASSNESLEKELSQSLLGKEPLKKAASYLSGMSKTLLGFSGKASEDKSFPLVELQSEGPLGQKDFVKEEISVPVSFPGQNPVAIASGKDLQKAGNSWRFSFAPAKTLGTDEAKKLAGKPYAFVACQFAEGHMEGVGFIVTSNLKRIAWKGPIQFGAIKSDSLQDVLLKIDQRFVSQLFVSETTTTLNPDGPLTTTEFLQLFPPEKYRFHSPPNSEEIQVIELDTDKQVAVYEPSGEDPNTGDELWKKKK